MLEYNIKKKEVEPKIYAIVFLNQELKQQVLKMVLAYTYEDAVLTSRQWMISNLGFDPSIANSFSPVGFESVKAAEIINYIVEGAEQVIVSENLINSVIINRIKESDELEANALFTKHRDSFNDQELDQVQKILKDKKTQ